MDIATPPTYTVLLVLDSEEELRLSIALHDAAQRYALKAENIAQLSANQMLIDSAQQRAEHSLSLLNKYRKTIGQKPLTPAEILDW